MNLLIKQQMHSNCDSNYCTGLDGVLQNITEKITLNTENKVKGITGGALESAVLKDITEDVAKKKEGDAKAIKSITRNADIGGFMKGIVDKVKSFTSPLDFKNKVKDEAEKSGISKDEIENTTSIIDRADIEIKSLNTTIAGQMVLDNNFIQCQNVLVKRLQSGQVEIVKMKYLLTYLLLKS